MSPRRLLYDPHQTIAAPHKALATLSSTVAEPAPPEYHITTGLLAALLLLLASAALFRKLRPWQSYLWPQPVLTANEREFYHRLTQALPTHPIFP